MRFSEFETLPWVIAAVVTLCGFAAQAYAQTATGDDDALDQELLKDLGDDLLEGLDDLPLDPSADGNQDSTTEDRQLLDDLGEGEDIGETEEDELTRIARQMRQVQRRMEQQEVSGDTQEIQKDIVAQLEALIKQLQQQKKQSSSSDSSKPSQGEKPLQQPDQPDAGQQPTSNKPASESEERLGQENAPASDAEALEALVKRVWGHLPDRARQEMQNATVEDFLPKYQQVIEDYYRRLAEQSP